MGRAVAGAVGLPSLAGPQKPQNADTLPVSRIRPGVAQPRRYFDPEKASALEASVRKSGILQPLLVRPTGGTYELVDGERRWRAAQAVGLSEVPVYIQAMTPEQARLAAMTTALARDGLSVLDEAEGKLSLAALELGMGLEEAKLELGRLARPSADPRRAALVEELFYSIGAENLSSFVRNKLPVLNYPVELQAAMREGLDASKAKLIKNAPESVQAELLERARAGASRAELARLAKAAQQQGDLSLEEQISRNLGSPRWRSAQTAAEAEATAAWLALAPSHLKSGTESR